MNFDRLTGQRIEIPAWTDAWMMGDRFGTIAGPGRKSRPSEARVLMDRSGRTLHVNLDAEGVRFID